MVDKCRLNIKLPYEQVPNPYVTPELCFQFHYFALRKMHFLIRAKALVAFPGGYGTMDELFEALTLLQTRKAESLPVVLVGREFWEGAINFEHFVDEGMPHGYAQMEMLAPARPAIDRMVEFLRKHV